MKRLLIALFCLAGLVSAQTAAPPEGEKHQWRQKVIDVKYADPNVLEKLLRSLGAGGLDRVVAQPDLHAISIGSADPSFLKLAEEIIKRYDVPQATPSVAPHQYGVEIVAHILLAAPRGSSGDALPADLEPVVKQLRSTFGYTDIRLLDSALILGREERGSEVTGSLKGLMEGLKFPAEYSIRIKRLAVESRGKRNFIALEGFKFVSRGVYEASGQTQFMSTGFDTDLNFPEGQKVVVGKAHAGTSDQAMILVLSARVVE
jgi:hypothetical protein